MKKILDTVVFDGYSLGDVLILVGAALILLILFRIITRIFKKEESSKYFQLVDCLSCGWRGRVSTLAGRCPKCNQPLGEQKARRMK